MGRMYAVSNVWILTRPVPKTPGGSQVTFEKVTPSLRRKIKSITRCPGGVCRAKVTFFKAFPRKKGLKISGACSAKALPHFGGHPPGRGGVWPIFFKIEVFTFQKLVSHPPVGGVGHSSGWVLIEVWVMWAVFWGMWEFTWV